jgi:predicted transcriptional regulator of viral defense system
MQYAYKNLHLEADVVRKLQDKLKAVFPDLTILPSEALVGPANKFDLYAKDKSGKEYFIEVKARRIHRVDVGQTVEQVAAVLKERPAAHALLLCSSIDPDVKEMLAKAGIETLVFEDLESRKTVKMAMSPREQRAYFALVRKEKKLVSTSDLASLMDISIGSAKNLLVALSRHGVIFRLGRGKYAVIPPDVLYGRKGYTADPYAVIDGLMRGQEYYVAYASAAHLHGIVTQLPFIAYVVTPKQRRPVDLRTTRIQFVTIKKSRFFGIEERQYSSSLLYLSDLEKTVVDCFDRSDLIGGMDDVARIVAEAISRVDWDKLVDYAKKMDREALIRRLGFVLEKLSSIGYTVPEAVLKKLDELFNDKFAYPLDPKVEKKGRVSHRWGIYENVNCLRWYRRA